MTIYVIQAYDRGQHIFNYAPELTASEWAAQKRKEFLEKQGMDTTITEYEVKTQGKNFNTVVHSKQ